MKAKTNKKAKADVTPVRQRTQYTCMSTSLMMCLQALGHKVTEDEVNDVMGARPKKGAAWEHALAAAQHYGCRATLVTPSTVQQLKQWTDRGIPVMIAWNPEGRPWSHASVVFDVDADLNVYVADPNIPDPDETVRIVPKGEFYSKWSEKWPDYIVRRPAMAVEREITPDGRQVMASKKAADLRTEVFEGEMQRGDSDYQGDTARYRDFADAVKRTRNWLGGKPRAEGWIERGKFHLDLIAEVESDDAPDEWGSDPLDDEGVTVQRIQFVVDGVPSEKDILEAKKKFKPRKWDVDVKTKYASSKLRQAVLQQPLMTMPDYGMSMEERWERGFQANDTDSGAGSDEDMFYKAPDKREVLEFARSKAISNSVEVAIEHAGELDIPLKQELKDVAKAPPLPTEIVEEPGGAAVSTLNRYVIKTDDPAVAPAVKMNKDRMAFWKAELEGFPKSADQLRKLMQELDALEELDANLNGVIEVFDASMKMAAKINPEATSQFEVLNKARKGIKSAEAIQKNIQAILDVYPEDKTAQRALKDASTMIARFKRTEKKAAAVVRRISKKEAPPALRKATASTKRALTKLLVDPSILQVLPWQGVTHEWVASRGYRSDQRVEGVEYQTVFRFPLENQKSHDIILFQSTLNDKGVMMKGSNGGMAQKWSLQEVTKWFLNMMKGSPLLKGEGDRNAQRAKVAPEIARAMEQYANRVGDTYRRPAEINGTQIDMSTRTDYDYADYGQYEEPDFPDFSPGLIKALKPWAQYIASYNGGYSEKGWYEFGVVLK